MKIPGHEVFNRRLSSWPRSPARSGGISRLRMALHPRIPRLSGAIRACRHTDFRALQRRALRRGIVHVPEWLPLRQNSRRKAGGLAPLLLESLPPSRAPSHRCFNYRWHNCRHTSSRSAGVSMRSTCWPESSAPSGTTAVGRLLLRFTFIFYCGS
jgi:hypothetical protein